MSRFNKGLSEDNENHSSFFKSLMVDNNESEKDEDDRSFPFYNSKDDLEELINELQMRDEKLKDLFYKLGDGGSHILTSEKNEVIENIIVQIDAIDRSYQQVREGLLNDKTSIKGLQLMHTTDLKAFDSIFED